MIRYFLFISIGFSAFSCIQNRAENADGGSSITFDYNNIVHLHKKLPEPKPGDWRFEHQEKKQSVSDFKTQFHQIHQPGLKTIYVQPIGEFDSLEMNHIEETSEYIKVFFGINTSLLETIDDSIIPKSARRIRYDHEQLQSRYILHEILKPNLPDDGVALFSITKKDLYPIKGWNFIFGQASPTQQVGIAFIHRLNPENNQNHLRRRLIRTATH